MGTLVHITLFKDMGFQGKFFVFLKMASEIFQKSDHVQVKFSGNLSILSGIFNYLSTITCLSTVLNADFVLQLSMKGSIS